MKSYAFILAFWILALSTVIAQNSCLSFLPDDTSAYRNLQVNLLSGDTLWLSKRLAGSNWGDYYLLRYCGDGCFGRDASVEYLKESDFIRHLKAVKVLYLYDTELSSETAKGILGNLQSPFTVVLCNAGLVYSDDFLVLPNRIVFRGAKSFFGSRLPFEKMKEISIENIVCKRQQLIKLRRKLKGYPNLLVKLSFSSENEADKKRCVRIFRHYQYSLKFEVGDYSTCCP